MSLASKVNAIEMHTSSSLTKQVAPCPFIPHCWRTQQKNMLFHSVNELLFIYLQDKALQHEGLQAENCTLRPRMMKIPLADNLNRELCGLFWISKRAVRQILKESS